MKKIILIIVLSFLNLDLHSKENSFDTYKINSQKILYALKEYSLYIAATPTLLYHYKNIIKIIADYPYLSSLCFYFFINYECDFFLDYAKQQEIYQLINKIKDLCLYLVVIHGIKNYIHQRNLCLYADFTEKQFTDIITQDLSYSLDEITVISLKFYHELKNYLQSLNMAINIESEEFAFLHYASLINLETIEYITQNKIELHAMITEFNENPAMNILSLTEYLKIKTTKSFMNFEKKLLKSNIHVSTKL